MVTEAKLAQGVARYVIGSPTDEYRTWRHNKHESFIVVIKGTCQSTGPRFRFNPLTHDEEGNPRSFNMISAITRTFAHETKAGFVAASFSATGAEFLTGMVVRLTELGASPFNFSREVRPGPRLSAMLTSAYTAGYHAAVDLAFVAISAYHDNGYAMNEATYGAIQQTVRNSHLKDALWLGGLEVSQIMKWAIRQFKGESIMCVVVEAILSGVTTLLPIMPIAARTHTENAPLPMLHPGGVGSAKMWWNLLAHLLFRMIVKQREDAAELLETFGEDGLTEEEGLWYKGDYHPALDVTRLIYLDLQDHIRPVVHFPSGSSYVVDVPKQIDMDSTLAYSQYIVTRHEKLHVVDVYQSLPDGLKMSDGHIARPVELLEGHASVEMIYPKAAVLAIEANTFPLADDDSPPQSVSGSVDDSDALLAARGAIKSEKYSDEKLGRILREGLTSKHHSKFWRAELWEAQRIYDDVLGSN